MGSGESKEASNSIQAHKIKEFFSYYGHKSGSSISQWIESMYSPNFYGSTTLNFNQSITISINKFDLSLVFERALKGKYRPRNIQFQKVDYEAKIIYYKWTNNIPDFKDSSKRIDIPFETYVVFDQSYKILKSVHKHCSFVNIVEAPQSECKRSQNSLLSVKDSRKETYLIKDANHM